MILVEVFDMSHSSGETCIKRPRHDPVLITSFGNFNPQSAFLSAASLWEALHSSPAFLRGSIFFLLYFAYFYTIQNANFFFF